MSRVLVASVGALLATEAELDSLPAYSVVLGDPEGLSESEGYRRIVIQKRPDPSAQSGSWWYPSWDTDIWNALATSEVVDRFNLGPFLVLHIPDAVMAAEAAT